MGRIRLLVTIVLVLAAIGFLGFQATKFVAFHGHEAAQWAVQLNQPKMATSLRMWSMKLRMLPPFNTMPEALTVGEVKLPETEENVPLEETKLVKTTVEIFDFVWKYRRFLPGVLLVLGIFAIVFLKGPREQVFGGIGQAFSTPDKMLSSVGNVAIFILGAMVAYESILGKGWEYVAQSFTQFIWLFVAGVALWVIGKAWGGRVANIVVGLIAVVVIAVFVISMANPGININNPSLKLDLSAVKEFSSTMYAGWSAIAKTYFWLLITAIGCLGLSSFFKSGTTDIERPERRRR